MFIVGIASRTAVYLPRLEKMKIVFMGTPEFASAILGGLIDSNHDILTVVTGQDKPVGRKRVLTPTVVRQLADRHSLPVITPRSLKSKQLAEQLDALKADLFVVAAFRILPVALFELARFGSINIHASLLPRYRGAAPINWAIINGEKETGLTSFFLQHTVDTGDTILRERVPIASTDTYDSLHQKLAEMAVPFTLKTLELIAQGQTSGEMQDDLQASPAPKIGPGDAEINFDQTADQVANFIRGMATKPGAYTWFRGQKLKVHFAQPAQPGVPTELPDDFTDVPGSLIPHKKQLLVQCGEGVVEITRLVPAGKQEMDGGSFINGFRPKSGESFAKKLVGKES